MERRKRVLFTLTFIVSLMAVAFLSASLATDFWISAYPKRIIDDDTEDGARNVTEGDIDTKFQGYINFGLFHGYKKLDHGLGLREVEIWIVCIENKNLCGWVGSQSFTGDVDRKAEIKLLVNQYEQSLAANVSSERSEHGLFNFGLWVCTILFVALSIVWGLVSMGFAVLNASTKPIETITGPVGLYLWNIVAGLFSLLAIVMYVVLYFTDLKENVLNPEDKLVFKWTSKDMAYLDYSFYFVLVALGLYILNLVIVSCSGIECKPMRYKGSMNEKNMDGVMMY